MRVDINWLQLSFKINDVDHGESFDIDNTKYCAAVSTMGWGNLCYTLISYQHFCWHELDFQIDGLKCSLL